MNDKKKKVSKILSSLVVVFLISFAYASFIDDSPYQQTVSTEMASPFRAEAEVLPDILPLPEIFEMTESGVVSITVEKSSTGMNPTGVGSGFVYDKQGHIITNNHVVENSKKIIVTFVDGSSFNAKIVGTDPFTDIAVIKIESNPDILNPLTIGDSSSIRVGEKVAAIGNPYGLSGSMTSGIVSQLGRLLPSQETQFSIPDVIQTDAAINPGNSGGPLLNVWGEVIGITTAIFSNDGNFSGVGFAVPSQTLSKIVPKLIEDGEYKQPWIGITTLNIGPDIAEILELDDAKGVLIMSVVKDSPADKAGLKGSAKTVTKDGIEYNIGGDVILFIDTKEVRKIDDILSHLQQEKNVGDQIILNVLRNGEMKNISVTLEERPHS